MDRERSVLRMACGLWLETEVNEHGKVLRTRAGNIKPSKYEHICKTRIQKLTASLLHNKWWGNKYNIMLLIFKFTSQSRNQNYSTFYQVQLNTSLFYEYVLS